jgi:hypothetical protein
MKGDRHGAAEPAAVHAAMQGQLMPKQQNLGFKPATRLEKIDQKQSKGMKDRNHRVS